MKTAEAVAKTIADKARFFLAAIVESSNDSIVTIDFDGVITSWNKSAERLYGYTAAEAIGQPLETLTLPQNIKQVLVNIEDIKKHKRTEMFDSVRVQKGGAERTLEIEMSPVKDDAGEVIGISTIARDATERRASDERYRTVADNVPQLIWTNDGRGVANEFNRRWYEYTGLSYEDSFGLGWEAIVHPDDAPNAIARWHKAVVAGDVFECEYRLRHHTGAYRWFIGRNVPVRNDKGRVISWFGTATDIHDLKMAEAARSEMEERFRLLVEGAKDYVMFLLNPDNTITFWSDGAERVLGWTAKEAIGQKGSIIFTPEDRERGAVAREIGVAAQNGRAPDRRWHVRKDGSRVWLDGVMRRIDARDGSVRGYAKIARDASDLREAEDQLRYARDQMEQRVLERTADLMATNNELERAMQERAQLERELLEISERERRRVGQDLHDVVCQELTATALFLKSTSNKIDNEEAAKTLSEAAVVVNRNVGVARDLARGFQPSALRAGGLIEALRGLCKQANGDRNIRCTLKLPKNIRMHDEVVALNLYRIAQEAVRNALSHSGGREIVICIEREKDLVRLVVEDNGKGFRPPKRSKGLGMHIMKYRANALGGTLMIDRRPKRGTKVSCEVPLKSKPRGRKTKK